MILLRLRITLLKYCKIKKRRPKYEITGFGYSLTKKQFKWNGIKSENVLLPIQCMFND